jgi:hypothetical protein
MGQSSAADISSATVMAADYSTTCLIPSYERPTIVPWKRWKHCRDDRGEQYHVYLVLVIT